MKCAFLAGLAVGARVKSRTATRITARQTRLCYRDGQASVLARCLMVKHEQDGTWTVYGATGPLGNPDSTFEDAGFRTKREAYAAADRRIEREFIR